MGPLGWAGILQLTRIETESSAIATRSCTALGAGYTETNRVGQRDKFTQNTSVRFF